MTAELDRIVAALPRLDAGERRKLAMLLSKHSGTTVKASKVINEFRGDWLLQGILHELERRGHAYRVTSMVKVRSLAPEYELTAQEVRRHLERQIELRVVSGATHAELSTLGNLAAEALADYFEPRMTIGLRPMLNVVGRTTEALDSAYPGYLASGMIYCLIQRKL